MPIVESIKRFLQSPNGRKVTEHGKRLAADPRNRERAKGLFSRRRRP